jgi:hypothetical protein
MSAQDQGIKAAQDFVTAHTADAAYLGVDVTVAILASALGDDSPETAGILQRATDLNSAVVVKLQADAAIVAQNLSGAALVAGNALIVEALKGAKFGLPEGA